MVDFETKSVVLSRSGVRCFRARWPHGLASTVDLASKEGDQFDRHQANHLPSVAAYIRNALHAEQWQPLRSTKDSRAQFGKHDGAVSAY